MNVPTMARTLFQPLPTGLLLNMVLDMVSET